MKVSDAEHKPLCASKTNWAAHANQRGFVYLASTATGRQKHINKNRPAGSGWWLWCGLLPSSCPATRPPSASWRLHSPSQTPGCWESTPRQLDGDQRKLPVQLVNPLLPESALDPCVVSVRWVEHVHFVRQQVWENRVVLKALNVVGTAEKCHFKRRKSMSRNISCVFQVWFFKRIELKLMEDKWKRKNAPVDIPLCLRSSLKPRVVRPGKSLLDKELRSTLWVSSSANKQAAVCIAFQISDSINMNQQQGWVINGRLMGMITNLLRRGPVDLQHYIEGNHLALYANIQSENKEGRILVRVKKKKKDNRKDQKVDLLGVTWVGEDITITENPNFVWQGVNQCVKYCEMSCGTFEEGMYLLIRSRASSAECSTRARTCSSAVLSVRLHAFPSGSYK